MESCPTNESFSKVGNVEDNEDDIESNDGDVEMNLVKQNDLLDTNLGMLPLPLDFLDNEMNSNNHSSNKTKKRQATNRLTTNVKQEPGLLEVKPKLTGEGNEDAEFDKVVNIFEAVETDGSLVQKFGCKICNFSAVDPKYLQRINLT